MRDGLQHAASFDPIGFLGPPGTFTEEALLADEELARSELVSYSSIAEALAAADCGEVGAAFVPMENSIEGTVPVTLDHLVFDSQLLIQKEAVLDVHLHLLAPVGLALEDIRRIVSFPHASAQCRRFLRQHVPLAELIASNSTADAARKVGANEMPGAAAIAPLLAGRLYGLEPVAEEIEDYDDNQTRFVLVAPGIVPPPSGHDRTSIVCFQGTDRPGSLLQILSHFSARSLNLTKLESRPTKQGLGDYCFAIDLEGHIADQVVGDCLEELHAILSAIKFLGSYPVAGLPGLLRREETSARKQAASSWLAGLRATVHPPASVRT